VREIVDMLVSYIVYMFDSIPDHIFDAVRTLFEWLVALWHLIVVQVGVIDEVKILGEMPNHFNLYSIYSFLEALELPICMYVRAVKD